MNLQIHSDKICRLKSVWFLLWLGLLLTIAGCGKNSSLTPQTFNTSTNTELALLRQQATSGTAKAQYELGHRLALDSTFPATGTEAVLWLRKAAAQGHASAQYEMGMLLINNHATNLEPGEELKWITAAAHQGHANAEFVLALLYDQGRYLEKDPVVAGQWIMKAAAHGNKDAQHAAGNVLSRGSNGFEINKTEAIKWYRAAAEQGHAVSQCELGAYYDRGIEVPQDYQEALHWYQLAASQGNSIALCSLGAMFSRGKGVLPDDVKAATYYLQAATQGNGMAQGLIGQFYILGKGVPKDTVQSYVWLTLAMRSPEAKKAAASSSDGNIFWEKVSAWQIHLPKEMTATQLTEAEQRIITITENLRACQAEPIR